MKSFQMKALALATLGLGGLVMAGSAFAACPTAVTTTGGTSPGGGGAWTSQYIAADASLNIVTPGLAGTSCALALSIGAISNSRAYVQDSSPQNESRYRGRFYLSLVNLTNFNVSNQTVVVFRANDTTGPAQFTSDELVVRLAGGATPTVRFFVSDSNQASGATQLAIPLPASASNTYRIEFDIQTGTGTTNASHGCDVMPATGGCLRAWVSDAAATSSDTSPSGSATVNNSGWSGVKTAYLGLSTGAPNYRANHTGTVLTFDEFDSRRQTFIGQ